MGEIEPRKTTDCSPDVVTWDEIELAESYLVCGMFKEAAEQASSILTRIHDNKYVSDNDEIVDMRTSLAMVLVQSWKGSGRTSDLLNELEYFFGSVMAIPVQVVLTGACVQVSSGHLSRVRKFLEDFLENWEFKNHKYFACTCPNVENTVSATFAMLSVLEVDQFLEVVQFYAVTLLGGILKDVDHAVLWVEKAQLPEEARQDLLRRLISLNPGNLSSSTRGATSSLVAEEHGSCPLSPKEVKRHDKLGVVFSSQEQSVNRSISNRLQNIANICCKSVLASNRKILFGCLIFLACYFFRKKGETIKRLVQRRALALKQALVDIWQLAFSYQVNPLAAVQPLPAPANRGR